MRSIPNDSYKHVVHVKVFPCAVTAEFLRFRVTNESLHSPLERWTCLLLTSIVTSDIKSIMHDVGIIKGPPQAS